VSKEAALFCPHSKDYCIGFQSKFATLKGIENGWKMIAADKSCEWENQQHGRNHHVKVLLRGFPEGSLLALQLSHEDETKAPDFTRTKAGMQRATMLIGSDSRESRLGLTWHLVGQEGPRKWRPASQVLIQILGPNCLHLCDQDGEFTTMLAPAESEVVLPIRIEVLSAAKGAGDFSRYRVKCFETTWEKARVPKPGGWSWHSPPILIEAKWLPAAPIRVTNKSRFGTSRRGGEQCDCGADNHGDYHAQAENGMILPQNSRMATIQHVTQCCKLLTSIFGDSTHSLGDSPQLDLCIQNLQCAISQYCVRRVSKLPQTQAMLTAPKPPGFSLDQLANSIHLHQLPTTKGRTTTPVSVPVNKTEPRVQSVPHQEPKKRKTAHELLSSPPRGSKFAPLSRELMATISLPSRAAATHRPQPMVLSGPRASAEDSFAILATAASAASMLQERDLVKQKLANDTVLEQ